MSAPPPIVRPTTCFGCGRKEKGVNTVGCMRDDLKVCDRCLKRHGAAALQLEGDRLLHVYLSKLKEPPPQATRKPGECFHCLSPILQNPNGTYNLWCGACERERQNLSTRSNASREEVLN